MANKRISDLNELTGVNVAPNDEFEIVDKSATENKCVQHSELLKSIITQGFWDYNDLETTATPISVTASTWTQLTNDGAGTNTNKAYRLPHIAEIWDATNDEFDFSELELGDTVDFRVDVSVTTTSANQEVDFRIAMAQGGSPYNLNMDHESYKTSGVRNVTFNYSIYMGDANTRDNPAEIQIYTDSSATVTVNGWYIRVTPRNPIGVNQT